MCHKCNDAVSRPWRHWRSYQCPPDSCRIPLESGHSGGFQWTKIWQEGLLIFPFWIPFIPVEFQHSGIETGMVCRIAGMECNQNPIVWPHHCQTNHCLALAFTHAAKHHHLFFPSHSSPPPALRSLLSPWYSARNPAGVPEFHWTDHGI